MITEKIVQIIRDVRENINKQIDGIETKHDNKEISTSEYTPQRDIMDAKMDTLLKIEDALGSIAGQIDSTE